MIERNGIGPDREVRFHDRRQALACVVLLMATGLPGRAVQPMPRPRPTCAACNGTLSGPGITRPPLDGRPGPATRRAIRSYQASIGQAADGEPVEQSNATGSPRGRPPGGHFVGWIIYENPAAGYRIGYPAAILPVAQARDPYQPTILSATTRLPRWPPS